MDSRTPAQVREHYEVEKKLAARLRNAARAERRSLYHTVYDERLRAIPHHPLLTRATNEQARARAVTPQLRLIRSFVHRDSVFMEVGPGDCALAMAVAQHVRHVYAIDVSDGLVQDAVRPKNFALLLSDGISVPVPPNSIDLAYSNQVMEHLHPEDAFDQLCHIYTALKPGGAYLCITPNRLSGPWDISRNFDSEATGLHLKEYTITEMRQLFRAVGFAQVKTFVSSGGTRLSPLMPVELVCAIEWALEKIPRGFTKQTANALAAIKVLAIK